MTEDIGEAVTTGETQCAVCHAEIRTYYTSGADPRHLCDQCAVDQYCDGLELMPTSEHRKTYEQNPWFDMGAGTMDRDEAIKVAKGWLKHCNKVRDRTERLQLLARDAKTGKLAPDEVRRVRNAIDGTPLVYDGARLEKAVRVLMKSDPR